MVLTPTLTTVLSLYLIPQSLLCLPMSGNLNVFTRGLIKFATRTLYFKNMEDTSLNLKLSRPCFNLFRFVCCTPLIHGACVCTEDEDATRRCKSEQTLAASSLCIFCIISNRGSLSLSILEGVLPLASHRVSMR